jgi:hypothetical protein
MKCVILLEDRCEPVSEASGFNLPYQGYVVEGAVTTAQFSSSALVPFSASGVVMKNAVVAQFIQAAAGHGKVVSANDCTLVGGIS